MEGEELPNYYQILGVTPRATEQEITRAYRNQQRIHHPDRGGNVEYSQQLNAAYSILKDAILRQNFDREVDLENDDLDLSGGPGGNNPLLQEDGQRGSDSMREKIQKWEEDYNNGIAIFDLNSTQLEETIRQFIQEFDSISSSKMKLNLSKDAYYCSICEKYFPSEDHHYDTKISPYVGFLAPVECDELYPTHERLMAIFGDAVAGWIPTVYTHSKESLQFWNASEWDQWEKVATFVDKCIKSSKEAVICDQSVHTSMNHLIIEFSTLDPFLLNQVNLNGVIEVKFQLVKWIEDEQNMAIFAVTLASSTSTMSLPKFRVNLIKPPENRWTCHYCHNDLGYVQNRRHHCRRCGATVCSSCSSLAKLYSYGYSEPVRSCHPCKEIEDGWSMTLWLDHVMKSLDKEEMNESDAVRFFQIGFSIFGWTQWDKTKDELISLFYQTKEKGFLNLHIGLARLLPESDTRLEKLATEFCTSKKSHLAVKCVLNLSPRSGADWLRLAGIFAKYLEFPEISAHCVLKAGGDVDHSKFLQLVVSIQDMLTPNCALETESALPQISRFVLNQAVSTCPAGRKNELVQTLGNFLATPKTRDIALFTFDIMKMDEDWIVALAERLRNNQEFQSLTILFHYVASNPDRFPNFKTAIPTFSVLYLASSYSYRTLEDALEFATKIIVSFITKSDVEGCLEVATLLHFHYNATFLELVESFAFKNNTPATAAAANCAILFAKCNHLITKKEIYLDVGLKLRKTDPTLADLCFLVGNVPTDLIAHHLGMTGEDSASVDYDMRNYSEKKFWNLGEECLEKGNIFRSHLYFCQILNQIANLSVAERYPRYIELAIILSRDKFNPQLHNLFKTIVNEFAEYFGDKGFFQMHNFMLSHFLDSKNEQLALGCLHFLDGSWDPILKEKFASVFAPGFKLKVTAALNSYSLISLADELRLTNARNVGGLEEILEEHPHFCGRNLDTLPAILRISFHLIKGCIQQIQGNILEAIQNFQICLNISPRVGCEQVYQTISTLIDFDLHFSTLQTQLGKLSDLLIRPDNPSLQFPDPLHKFKDYLNFTDNQNLVTIRKVEVAIKRLSSFEGAMSYLDLKKGVEGGVSLISCWISAIAKLLEGICTKGQSNGRVYASSRAIMELATLIFLFSRRICTPHFEGVVSSWLLKALLATSYKIRGLNIHMNLSPSNSNPAAILLKQLLQSTLDTLKVNPFVLNDTFSSVLDNLYIAIIQTGFQAHFFQTRIQSGVNSSILPAYLFAYHKFDGVWRGWIEGDFQDCKETCISLLLSARGWGVDLIKTNLEWGLQPRDEDGFLKNHSRLRFSSRSYEAFDGFVFYKKSGGVEFLLRNRPFYLNLIKGRKPKLFTVFDVLEVCSKELSSAFFTLEEPTSKGDPHMRSHPFQEIRYGPPTLAGTNYLATMARADILLKEMTTGVEISSKPPFPHRPTHAKLLSSLPPEIAEILKPIRVDGISSLLKECVHRFWIEIENVPFFLEETEQKQTIRFGPVVAALRTRPMVRNAEGELEDVEEERDSPEYEFAAKFTENYDKIGSYFPELMRLKELMKMSLMARILKIMAAEKLESKTEAETPTFYNDLLPKITSTLREIHSKISEFPLNTPTRVREERDKAIRNAGASLNQVPWDTLNKLEARIRSQLEVAERDARDNYAAQFSDAFKTPNTPQLKGLVYSWLCSGNSAQLGENFTRGMVQAKIRDAATVLEKLASIGILPETKEDEEEHTTNNCPWVPAAFCHKNAQDSENIRKVYGGVSMRANGVPAAGRIASSLGTSNIPATATGGGNENPSPPPKSPPQPSDSSPKNVAEKIKKSVRNKKVTNVGRKIGPSDKPFRHFKHFPNRKAAEDGILPTNRTQGLDCQCLDSVIRSSIPIEL